MRPGKHIYIYIYRWKITLINGFGFNIPQNCFCELSWLLLIPTWFLATISNPSLLADQATMKRLRELTGALLEMPHYLVPIHGCKNLGFPTKQVRVVHHDSTPPSRSDNPYSLEPTHNIIYIIYAVLSTAFIHKKKAHPTAKKQSLLPSFLYLSVDFLVVWLANISNSYGPLTKYIS